MGWFARSVITIYLVAALGCSVWLGILGYHYLGGLEAMEHVWVEYPTDLTIAFGENRTFTAIIHNDARLDITFESFSIRVTYGQWSRFVVPNQDLDPDLAAHSSTRILEFAFDYQGVDYANIEPSRTAVMAYLVHPIDLHVEVPVV